MTDHEKVSKEHFDGMAENYAATDGTYYSPLPKISCDEIAARLADVKFGSLLDVGCGSGYLISILAGEHGALFSGLDISPKMLEKAAEKLASVPGVTLTEGRAGALPYPAESFDIVTCVMSFHHYPYPETAVSEAYRVLREGGLYILSDVDREGYGAPEEGEFATYTAASASELLRAAGFEVEESFSPTEKSFYVSGRKPRRAS